MSTKGRPGVISTQKPKSSTAADVNKSRKSPVITIATNSDPATNPKNVRQPKAIVKNLDDKDLVSSVAKMSLHCIIVYDL